MINRDSISGSLEDILPLLNLADPSWVIFGSASLVLNGVPGCMAHDVDILMTRQGALRAKELLQPYLVETLESSGGKFRSLQTHYLIKGIDLDISGDLEVQHEDSWIPIRVENVNLYQGLRYASLQDCLRLLALFNRPKDRSRMALVEDFIAKRLPDEPTSSGNL